MRVKEFCQHIYLSYLILLTRISIKLIDISRRVFNKSGYTIATNENVKALQLLVNREGASHYHKKIKSDPDYNIRDDMIDPIDPVTDHAFTMMQTILVKGLNHQENLEFRIDNKFLLGKLKTLRKDFLSTIRTGDMTKLAEAVNYVAGGDIAHKKGYDKGRSKQTIKGINEIEDSQSVGTANPLLPMNGKEWDSVIQSARLSPQEELIVQSWISGELEPPVPGKKRGQGQIMQFCQENNIPYEGIRSIESRAKKKLRETLKK